MATPTPIVYPDLPPDLKQAGNWKMLRYFGAGAIIASVTIGSGETVFASQAGAIFNYSLIWCFLFGAIMKGVQIYTSARYLTLTGVHPIAHWGYLPGPRNWVPWTIGILSLACFPFWLAGLPMIIGQTVNWIFGIDVRVLGMSSGEWKGALAAAAGDPALLAALEAKNAQLHTIVRLWATGFIAFALTITWLQTYAFLEKAQLIIVGALLLSLMAACIAVNPDWLAALAGCLPSVPSYPDWIPTEYPDIARDPEWVKVGVCLGAIGGGTYDYIGYIGCFREKAWGVIGRKRVCDEPDPELHFDLDPENVRRGLRWLRPAQIDVSASFLTVMVFTACFVILGAVILHTDHDVPDQFQLLSKQSRFLTQFHPALLYLYQFGIFMAFFGTILGAYEIYIRTAYECLAPVSARIRAMPEVRFRALVLLYCAIGGLSLVWFGSDNIMRMVAPAAIVGGVFTCGLWCFAMLWLEKRFLPAPLRMRPVLRVANWISGILLTALGVQAIWDYLTQSI